MARLLVCRFTRKKTTTASKMKQSGGNISKVGHIRIKIWRMMAGPAIMLKFCCCSISLGGNIQHIFGVSQWCTNICNSKFKLNA